MGIPSLQTADYVIFVGMFLLSIGIGIRFAFFGQKSKSREAFFVAERQMHFIPLTLSLLVTYESSIMMLGLPAEVYVYGTGVVFEGFGYLIPNLLVVFISVPLFKPLKITSVYEYLQQRFGSKHIRRCGVFLYISANLLYLGVILYAQAVAVQAVMGINMWISILVMDACAILYTSLGGIKSVIWTDVFQACVMFVGIFAVIIKGTIETGGTLKVWEYASAGKRLEPFDFDPDPTVRHTVWTTFLPKALHGFHFAFNQSNVQRISASKSAKDARRMILLAAPLFLMIFLIVLYEGLVIYAYFSQQDIEPLSCGLITNPNQIAPYAVLVLFQSIPGMTGLYMASLYSASLSMSILVMEDLFKPLLKNTPERRATAYAKLSVVALGIGGLLFCFLSSFVEGPFQQVVTSLMSACVGPLTGLFFLACFFPSVKAQGAAIGLLAGFALSATLTVGGSFSPNVRKSPWLPLDTGGMCDIVNSSSPMNITSTSTIQSDSVESYNPFFSLSYCLFSPLGTILTISIGVLSSFIVGRNRPGDIHPKYFLEISDSILVWLPPPVRRWLKAQGSQFKSGWKKSPPLESTNDVSKYQPISTDNQDQLQLQSSPASMQQDIVHMNLL